MSLLPALLACSGSCYERVLSQCVGVLQMSRLFQRLTSSPDVKDYRPISITPILAKIFEKLLSAKLSQFCESRSLFPSQQFSYRKNYGCVDALLSISNEIQNSFG